MSHTDACSDSELEDTSKITETSADPASCLNYLKRREVFLYKMMNDPSHKAMLYFLEVLMNSDAALTIDQLAARFTNKSFSTEMRDACGGGSTEALKNFLLKYPSLFTVKPSGLVTAVAIDFPGFDEMSEASVEFDCTSSGGLIPKYRTPSVRSKNDSVSSTADGDVYKEISKSNSQCEKNYSQRKAILKSPTNDRNEIKPIGIYKPPILRAEASMNNVPFCEMCSIAAHVATTSATTTVVHCPFAEHRCPHHTQRCQPSPLKHTHSASHCCCVSSSMIRDPVSHCSHVCPSSVSSSSTQRVISMDNFAVETEAVKFFQQRLNRREEKWVPIKSLAGHLSQASSEVRFIVGPQLEFRRFLLKHPHVFEVQGDLVGLTDHFSNTCLSRRPKSFIGGIHSSSSTSLSALNHLKGGLQKVCRPKSLIMLSQANNIASSHHISNRYMNSKSAYFPDDYRSNEELNYTPTNRLTAAIRRPTTSYLNRVSSGTQFTNNLPATQQQQQNNALVQHDLVTSSVNQQSSRKQVSTTQTQEVNPDTSSSICIRMSANEYRAIMFLRKVLVKKGGAPGQTGLSFAHLMQILSAKAPETVQNVIGWTKIELKEFIIQHPIFFEVHESRSVYEERDIDQALILNSDGSERPFTLVTNRRVLKMINILITGNRTVDTGTRTLTNRCGQVFHVAKLWGIIDLGKHEHVFFDKSIFKYVDDLQKHFKVNETLYFNAVLAAKESRAKWRATHVWKECDKAMMEKFGKPALGGRPHTDATGALIPESSSSSKLLESGGEIEHQHNQKLKYKTSPDSDYGLLAEEEVDDDEAPGCISALARSEGLNLANDIKFLSDDVEEELERLLGPQVTNGDSSSKLFRDDSNLDCQFINYASDEDTSMTGCLEDISVNFSNEGSGTHSLSDFNSIAPACNRVTSSTNQKQTPQDKVASERSSSIAVQTLSTGDIMATQIFHDMI